MSFVRMKALIAVSGTFAVLMLVSGSAEAQPPPYLLDCNSPGPTYTKPDGTTFVTGTTAACGAPSSSNLIFVAKLKPDGTIDQAFANGGSNPGGTTILDKPSQGIRPVAFMPAASGGYVLVTNSEIMKVREAGNLDANFGFFGQVTAFDTDYLHHPITAAAQASDGSIYVAGGNSFAGMAVARFDADGHLDLAFGTDGVKTFSTPAGKSIDEIGGMAIDSSGRIILGGVDYDNIVAMRLLTNGNPDPAFGADSDGFAEGPPGGEFADFARMYLDDSGNLRIYSTGTPELYSFQGYEAEFSGSGALVNSFGINNHGSGAIAETPGGGLVTSIAPGRGDQSTFNLSKAYPGGPGGFNRTEYDIAPVSSSVDSVEYVPSTDSVVATGSGGGYTCASLCSDRGQVAVLKADAKTGNPDSGFGVNGVALVPGNKCNYDVAYSADVPKLAWNRCRVKSPETNVKFRYVHPHTRGIFLAGAVNISGPQEKPGFMRSRTVIKLPKSLRLKPGKLRKAIIVLTYISDVESKVPAKVAMERGRVRITVDIQPDASNYSPYVDNEPPNPPAKIYFGVKPGAIKKIRNLRGPFGYGLSAKSTYMPVDPYSDPEFPSRWFGNSQPATAYWKAKPGG